MVHACGANGLSERRACKVLEIDWYSMHDSSVWPDDADYRKAIQDFDQQRRRFGSRLICVILVRAGQWFCQTASTNAGDSTFSLMLLQMVFATVFCWSSMTKAASVWCFLLTHHCLAVASSKSLMESSLGVVITPKRLSRINARILRVWQYLMVPRDEGQLA